MTQRTYAPVVPLFLEQLGTPSTRLVIVAGVLFSLAALGEAFSAWVSGRLASRISISRLLLVPNRPGRRSAHADGSGAILDSIHLLESHAGVSGRRHPHPCICRSRRCHTRDTTRLLATVFCRARLCWERRRDRSSQVYSRDLVFAWCSFFNLAVYVLLATAVWRYRRSWAKPTPQSTLQEPSSNTRSRSP